MKPPRKPCELAAMRTQLQPLADAGLSTAGAALLLGVTRNTVIGRARDCGVRFDGPRPKTGGCNREQALRGWATRRARTPIAANDAHPLPARQARRFH
ncbi:hypothetical protein [Brevundimonas sp.]|uniref:hypothetical protein n=1 Tax=Brevundimonas sp. TaxID=1871086 RepID=UPI00286AFAF7|nr:hypothetical protein [Brevundimonas sp.]